MFFSQFYKSQNIEYRECRWNVENYCTTYDEKMINNFISKLTSKFYFNKNIDMDKININDLENTLNEGRMLIIN